MDCYCFYIIRNWLNAFGNAIINSSRYQIILKGECPVINFCVQGLKTLCHKKTGRFELFKKKKLLKNVCLKATEQGYADLYDCQSTSVVESALKFHIFVIVNEMGVVHLFLLFLGKLVYPGTNPAYNFCYLWIFI